MTSLMAGLVGWNGIDMRFQPGAILSLVADAAFNVNLYTKLCPKVASAFFKAMLPAKSLALIVRV